MPKPPLTIEQIAGAAVVLLQKLVNQTDEIEPLLQEISAKQDETNALLQQILAAVSKPPDRVLTTIKLVFKEYNVSTTPPIPITPPVVLTQAGQQVQAQVIGFDQFGNPWNDVLPDYTLTNDNESAATLDPIAGIVTAVADGVANITGELTTAEGLALSDTESVTVSIAAVPPVLTTIQVVFTAPAGKKAPMKAKPVVRR